MASKPKTEIFTQDWQKTVNWAKQNKIPYAAYYPIYQQDAQKFVSTGSYMSEPERIQAIQAANGLTPGTALPTDVPDWKNFPGNAKHNAADIFTGLNPIHLVGNIFDTVKNTVEHPSSVLNPLADIAHGDTGAAARAIETPNNILNFIPGVADLATVFAADPHLTGSKGFEALAQNPISAVLDVVPFGRLASEAVGRTATGEVMASKIGVAPAELQKMGIWRVGSRYVKSTPLSPGTLAKMGTQHVHPYLVKDASGKTVDAVLPTIGDVITEYRNKFQIGKDQGEITKEQLIRNQQGTRLVKQLVQPALKAISDLLPAQREELTNLAQTNTKPLSEVQSDPNISPEVRDAYAKAYKWQDTMRNIQMEAGTIITVDSPFKDSEGKPIAEYYSAEPGTAGPMLQRLLADSKSTQDAVDKAMKPVAAILFKTEENDRKVAGLTQAIDTVRNSVYESIARQIPHVGDTAAERLQSVLPEGEGWTRAVDENTPPVLKNLFGIPQDGKLSLHHINAIRDLLAPGGLVDQMIQAYKDEDWVKMNKFARMAKRKFDNKVFDNVGDRSQLRPLKNMVGNFQKYAADRQRLGEEAGKRINGVYRGHKLNKAAYNKSVIALGNKAYDAHQKFVKASIEHPPDIWNNIGMRLLTNKLADLETHAQRSDDLTHALVKSGWDETEVTKLRQSSRNMFELMQNAAKMTTANSMLPDFDPAEFLLTQKSMFTELATLRARGETPLYVPMLTVSDVERGDPTYNTYIRGIEPRRQSASFARTWGYHPTIYDVGAGMLKATKQMVEEDVRRQFVEDSVKPRLLPSDQVQAEVRNYYAAEIGKLADDEAAGLPVTETALSIIQRGIEKMGLVAYNGLDSEGNRQNVFGPAFNYANLDADYYIHKDIAQSFKKTLDTFQFPGQSIIDRGTNIFRTSILGLSPRYTAHILLGGAFMIAIRANPSILAHLGESFHVALHGEFSEKTLAKLPWANEILLDHTTEEGVAGATYQYHRAMMRHAGAAWLIPEFMANHFMPTDQPSRIRAALELNMRFTRAIRRGQTAAVYLSGAHDALRKNQMYYADDYIPREQAGTDKDGRPVDSQGRRTHNALGKQIHDQVRRKTPMTPEQAHKIGMDAVVATMGDLRNMTPLERSVFQKVFPFYGWTKHVLQYVMSYPFDHPYRAMILSQIAEQQSTDTALGLPTRIQLLTFLGQPDIFGNVTAIDTKALDPFRDTANYASITGLFESFNPAITALPSIVDPQFTFGAQNPYPNITFNQLYGTSQAGPGGSPWNAAEQFIPQLSAIDQALNLSGQYAYLRTSNSGAFSKRIYESLGLPFTPQQLNLRQMAAKEELDRFYQAQAAGQAAAKGDSSALAGYPANARIPDPLNPYYNVTPAYINAMNQQSEDTTGLPYAATAVAPRNPPL